MNDYFNAPATPVDFTVARATAIRTLFAAVAAAFDLLPSRAALLQGRVNYAVAGGTANALTADFTVNPDAYVEGASFRLKLSGTNTGPATLNVHALGAVQIVDSNGAALVGGELVASHIQDFTYADGVFRLPASGPQGPVGPAAGNTIYNGNGAPAGALGKDGDFYIETVAGVPTRLYGPKAAGAWPASVNIIGTNGLNGLNGTNGNTVMSGAADPLVGQGVNGDYFINYATWTIFGPKAGGAWPAGHAIMDLSDLPLTGLNTVQPEATAYEIGFRDIPLSRSVAVNFTLAAADRGKFIEYTDTTDICTVPLNASVAIGVGSVIMIVNNGTGALAINREAGAAMKYGGVDANRSLAVGGFAILWKTATNTWLISGQLIT